METKKISDTMIEITKEAVAPPKQRYERSFIEGQIEMFTRQRNDMIAIKDAELKEYTDILAEMDKLGIVSVTPKEAPIEEIKP
jgi:hypothetical protein